MINNRISAKQANWYAVYTRSRAEKKLFALLSQKNVECFLPLKKTLQQRSDRKKWVQLPLIPSYVFVRITEKEQFSVLNTPGAVCYVNFGGKPVAIPEEQVTSLSNFINLEMKDPEVYYGNIEEGELVEVVAGPLKGVKGEVLEIRGKERLLFRFDSLGCCVHIEVNMGELKIKNQLSPA